MAIRKMLADVLGFPIRVRGDAACPAWSQLGLRASRKATKRRPALTVVITADSSKANTADTGIALRGTTFVLDLKKKVLFLEPPRTEQAWARTVVFVLGLLAEHHGPNSVARVHARHWAPLLLHSSAVRVRNGALVFCGHSTFGKTTIATKLLRNYPLINEDLNILLVGPYGGSPRKGATHILVDRTPRSLQSRSRWREEQALPVRGLFWLKKSSGFKLEPMGFAEAVSNMLPPLFGLWRPENAKHRLSMLRALLNSTACVRLYFRKTRSPLVRLLEQHDYL